MSPKYEKTQRFRWVIVVGERGFEPRIARYHNRRFPLVLQNCMDLVLGLCVGVQCVGNYVHNTIKAIALHL